MKKMKMSCEPQDRLSELPDSLIFNIFEFLPMKDVVRTQILSHRWENLWTITPNLYFDAHGFGNCENFRNFINRALLCWKGQKIQKFKVSSICFPKSIFKDLDLWLRFAVYNGVEELDSFFKGLFFKTCNDEYRVPKCLYSCPSLQKLSLFGSIIEINGNVMQWNQLRSLEILCYSITQHAIELVLSKCPVLEVFSLSFEDKDNNLSLSFRSTSLKQLSVCKRFRGLHEHDVPMSELRIWTPNLKILSLYGEIYGKCLLMNVSSLTNVSLWFFSEKDHLGVPLSQIIPTIQHVERLTLSHYCIKVLGAMTSNFFLSPMSSVMFLKLDGGLEEHEQVVGLLEIFPKLKTLIVNENSTYIDPKRRTKRRKSKKSKKNYKKKFIPNPSELFLAELRTVEITWTMEDFLIFPLIEILLTYASKLEKMVFQVRRIMIPYYPSNTLTLASQKLLKMLKSSPNANFIFGEC